MLSTIKGKEYRSTQLTYNERDDVVLGLNAFTYPNYKAEPPRVYHIKTKSGFKSYYLPNNAPQVGLTKQHFSYLKTPPQVYRGETEITAGANVLLATKEYYVTAGTVVHNNVTYRGEDPNIPGSGDTFVAVNTSMTGAGKVVLIVSCILPDSTHEEICKTAAGILAGTVDDTKKNAFLQGEERKS